MVERTKKAATTNNLDIGKLTRLLDRYTLQIETPNLTLDRDIPMNGCGLIEVPNGGREQTIGTRSLAGCFGIVAVVEDRQGDRRVSLAHYDPMAVALELEGTNYRSFPTIQRLFGQTGRTDKANLTKKAVIVMAQNPEYHSRVVDIIRLEAQCLLGCEDLILPPYAVSDFLKVTLPNSSGGKPSYRTVSGKKVLQAF